MRKIGAQCPGAQGVGFGAVLVLRMAKRMSAGALGLGCCRGFGCGHAQVWHGCAGLNCGAGEPAEAHILAWIVLKIMGRLASENASDVYYVMWLCIGMPGYPRVSKSAGWHRRLC